MIAAGWHGGNGRPPIFMETKQYKYCPLCASALGIAFVEERDRQVCRECGWINYRNPLPVVACLVRNDGGDLLLIKRGIEPCVGAWALPGGFIETEETIAEAGARELLEETGLIGMAGRLIDVCAQNSSKYGPILIAGMEFIVEGGDISVGDDASDAAFFSVDEIPEIPFSAHRNLIAKFN
jgi:8-oxo-dGTP diphosphatase